jgi:phosphoglucomutase/phosphomannomutase
MHHKYGYHREHLINLFMEGSEGMAAMQRLMQSFRTSPPATLAGIQVAQIRDYSVGTITDTATGNPSPLAGPTGDLVIMDLADEGNYVAVRPSGTEPKIKLYVFTRLSPAESQDLDQASAILESRIKALEADVRAYAKGNA